MKYLKRNCAKVICRSLLNTQAPDGIFPAIESVCLLSAVTMTDWIKLFLEVAQN